MLFHHGLLSGISVNALAFLGFFRFLHFFVGLSDAVRKNILLCRKSAKSTAALWFFMNLPYNYTLPASQKRSKHIGSVLSPNAFLCINEFRDSPPCQRRPFFLEYTIFPIQLHLIRVSCVQIALSDRLRLCVHFSDYSFGNGVRKRWIRTPELYLNFTTSFTTSLFMYLYVILCNRMLHEKRKKALLYKGFPYIATLFRLKTDPNFNTNAPPFIVRGCKVILGGAFLGQGGAKNFEFIKPFKLISICYWDY